MTPGPPGRTLNGVREAGGIDGGGGSGHGHRGSRVGWALVCGVALVSAAASLGVYVLHVPDFFMGDDFELIGDALAGVSPLEPVASHFRPLVRLHFIVYRWVPSPEFFGALSVLLHALASAAVFAALEATHGRRVALPTSLLFFASFLANEAVFWSASVGLLYCMLFCALSLACFARGRLLPAYAALVPAALSYELWLVVPLLFLLFYRRARELVVPFGMAGLYVALHLGTLARDGVAAYGGFSLAELPMRFAVYAYRFLSPLEGTPSLSASLALTLLLLSLLFVPRFRFPALLYASSALIFSLSAHVASRFYYFPALALILLVVLGLQSAGRHVRLVSAVLLAYLAVTGPWINSLDGDDYARKADLHRELYDAFAARIDRLAEGEQAVVVNRLGPERLQALAAQRVGRPKLDYVRLPAMAGMIYADDAVRMALWERAGRPERTSCAGRTIEVGSGGDVRSTYCFRIAPR